MKFNYFKLISARYRKLLVPVAVLASLLLSFSSLVEQDGKPLREDSVAESRTSSLTHVLPDNPLPMLKTAPEVIPNGNGDESLGGAESEVPVVPMSTVPSMGSPTISDDVVKRTSTVPPMGSPTISDDVVKKMSTVPPMGSPTISDDVVKKMSTVPPMGSPTISDDVVKKMSAVPPMGSPTISDDVVKKMSTVPPMESPAISDGAVKRTSTVPPMESPAISDGAVKRTSTVPPMESPAIFPREMASAPVGNANIFGKSSSERLNPVIRKDNRGPNFELGDITARRYYNKTIEIAGKADVGTDKKNDIRELYWYFSPEEKERRPIYVDQNGYFSTQVSFFEKQGNVELVVVARNRENQLTSYAINLKDGRKPPEIQINNLKQIRSFGSAGLLISGRVSDPYAADPEYGGYKSLTWKAVPRLSVLSDKFQSGNFYPDRNGYFSISFVPEKNYGDVNFSVSAEGRNGIVGLKSFSLQRVQDDIPDFRLDEGDRRVTVYWNLVPDVRSYNLELTSDVGKSNIRLSQSGQFVVRNLVNGRYYKARLVAEAGDRKITSARKSFVPLSRQTLYPSSKGEFGRIRLQWDAIGGSGSYLVFRADGKDNDFRKIAIVQENRFVDTRNVYGVSYRYAIAPAERPDFLSLPATARTIRSPRDNVENIATYEGFSIQDFIIERDYAYIAGGEDGFIVFDIHNPAVPAVVARLEDVNARSVAVRGEYAYVLDPERGLVVINISTATRPRIVATRKVGNFVDMALGNSYMYITDPAKGVVVYDVLARRQNNIRSVKTLALDSPGIISIQGDFAYVVMGGKRIGVIGLADGRDVNRLRLLHTIEIPGGVNSIHVSDGLLSVITRAGGVELIDISPPASASILSSIAPLGAKFSTISDDYLFLSTEEGSLVSYDIHDAGNPGFFNSAAGQESRSLIVNKDDYIFSAKPDGVNVIQIYFTGKSHISGTIKMKGRGFHLATAGGDLIASKHAGGLDIFNLDGRLIQNVPASFVLSSAVEGNRLAYIDFFEGLQVMGRQQGGKWEKLLSDNSLSKLNDVAISRNLVAVSSVEQGVAVFDIPPDADKAVGIFRKSIAGLRSVDLGQDVLAVGARNGIVVFRKGADGDYGIGRRLEMDGVKDIVIADENLLVASRKGMSIIDINNPDVLREISVVKSSSLLSIGVEHNYAFLSEGAGGLRVYDILNPALPILVSENENVFAFNSATVYDRGIIYVANISGIDVMNLVVPKWLIRSSR